MSDPKLISPLLDGFTMGNPISDHNGVRCCPAIKENSDKKYIVKIISIPASQVQMDALLLTGAYKDPADAMDYFRLVGEDVMKEAELLKTLSKLDGFLSYEGWQMEPITKHRLGYEVFLTGSYKRSLDKYVRLNPVTHLEAVNLGLDMCAALSVCRQAGALYVDLKPSNIFISDKKEYRIGDLGFVSLDALKYTVLPDKYRSAYSPPELHDSMATINPTADTYALGMILYQLYNDGQLPVRKSDSEEPMSSPVNADYELAEIIMKAIHPDPEQRWTDPKDLGRALVEYMQRNCVNDVPITPYTPLEVDPEDVVFFEKRAEAESADVPSPEISDDPASVPVPVSEPAEEASCPAADASVPDESDAEALLPHEMSDDLSRIMAKADDLISHETPEGVVVPAAPEPPDPFAFASDVAEDEDDSGVPIDPLMEDALGEKEKTAKKKRGQKFISPESKKRTKRFLAFLVVLLVLAGAACGGYWFYQNMYLQTVDGITLTGDKTQLTVTVDSQIPNGLLTAVCSNNYGSSTTQEIIDGQTVFTGLLPNTMYKVQLEISGFHELTGKTSEVFTTETTTDIVTFTAVTGADDGSVMLNFTVDGDEPEEWTVRYATEGEDIREETFTGHSVTVTGLSVGKVYTFTLDAGEDLSLSGNSTLEFMASRLILAQDLTLISNGGNDMTVRWNAPGDIVVESWNVRCYSSDGYEVQLTVQDTEVFLSDIDPTVSYTVEVTAHGMIRPAYASISANPISITSFNLEETDDGMLRIGWDFSGTAPTGGWLLMYTIDGSEVPNVIKCADASAVISPRVPGAKYEFTLQAADSTSIFGNVHVYTCADALPFEGHALKAQDVSGHLVKTPEQENWILENIGTDAFTEKFLSGEKISVVLQAAVSFYLPEQEMKILFVVEDAYGNVLPRYVSQATESWKKIWYEGDYHYGELDIPSVPTEAGDYVLYLYFDGALVAEVPFAITE